MAAPFLLDLLAGALTPVFAGYGSVRDDEGAWVPEGAPLFDETDAIVFVSAELHPSDARDAARDLLERLEAAGLSVQRAVPRAGNSLSSRLARLADQITQAGTDPGRLDLLAAILAGLAEEAQALAHAQVPAAARLDHAALPAGVVALRRVGA